MNNEERREITKAKLFDQNPTGLTKFVIDILKIVSKKSVEKSRII